MKFAFLDTNAFMHFKVFEGINWKEFLSTDDYTLVVSLTVLDELDKYKDSTKTKKRNRAKTVLKILSEYLDDENYKKNNINLRFCENAHTEINSSEYNGGREDDFIIASAKAFDEEGDKIIVSNDIGMKFRAKNAGLKFLKLDESQMLSQELTDEEKEIKELKKEIAKLTNRKASPVLLFHNEENTILRKAFIEPDFSEFLSDEEEKLRKDIKPFIKHDENPYESLHSKLARIAESEYEEKDIEEYNSSIEPYISEMLKLKSDSLKLKNRDRFVYELKLLVFNKGTKPTGRMGLQIFLPEELIFLDDNAWIEYNVTPPERPKLLSPIQKMMENALKNNYLLKPIIPGYGPILEKDNNIYEKHWDLKMNIGHQIFYTLSPIIHNLSADNFLKNSLYFFAAKTGNHTIRWRIAEESNVDPITGELTIIIE